MEKISVGVVVVWLGGCGCPQSPTIGVPQTDATIFKFSSSLSIPRTRNTPFFFFILCVFCLFCSNNEFCFTSSLNFYDCFFSLLLSLKRIFNFQQQFSPLLLSPALLYFLHSRLGSVSYRNLSEQVFRTALCFEVPDVLNTR